MGTAKEIPRILNQIFLEHGPADELLINNGADPLTQNFGLLLQSTKYHHLHYSISPEVNFALCAFRVDKISTT